MVEPADGLSLACLLDACCYSYCWLINLARRHVMLDADRMAQARTVRSLDHDWR